MRFTYGYWQTRPESKMGYAAECYRIVKTDTQWTAVALNHRVDGRGDTLDGPALEVSFAAPMEGGDPRCGDAF